MGCSGPSLRRKPWEEGGKINPGEFQETERTEHEYGGSSPTSFQTWTQELW